MMTSVTGNENGTERDEIEALIPWYATGKLAGADRGRVERYLAAHPEAAVLVALSREEADATFAVNEAIAAPGRAALDRLMARIEAAPRRRAAVAAKRIRNRWTDWLDSLTSGQLALAGAVGAFLILVQAASIGTLLIDRGGPAGFETATRQREPFATKGTFALVGFAPDATAEALTGLLSKMGAEIVEGPRAGGVYRIRLSMEKLDKDAAAHALESLTARNDLVTFATLTQ